MRDGASRRGPEEWGGQPQPAPTATAREEGRGQGEGKKRGREEEGEGRERGRGGRGGGEEGEGRERGRGGGEGRERGRRFNTDNGMLSHSHLAPSPPTHCVYPLANCTHQLEGNSPSPHLANGYGMSSQKLILSTLHLTPHHVTRRFP